VFKSVKTKNVLFILLFCCVPLLVCPSVSVMEIHDVEIHDVEIQTVSGGLLSALGHDECFGHGECLGHAECLGHPQWWSYSRQLNTPR
jgi:hypothetical protein